MNCFKFFLWLPLIITCNATAGQLQFDKKEQEQNFLFHYQWIDHQQQAQSISFLLPKEALFERFRQFKAYKTDLAEKYVQRAIRKQLRKEPLPGIQVYFRHQHDGTYVDIKGRDTDKVALAYAKVAKLERDYFSQHLSDSFYHRFITHDRIQGIKPDHVRIANISVEDIKPIKQLILEKVSIRNIRQVTNYILSFVQSIPYSTLESRMTSSGAGFSPPLKLLWENQGDCDSKLTLAAALLRTLMPRIKMIMVFMDQHAFLGLEIPAIADEITITDDNVTYVLAEPTGPALLKLGIIDPVSAQAIYQGQYITELYHQIIETPLTTATAEPETSENIPDKTTEETSDKTLDDALKKTAPPKK